MKTAVLVIVLLFSGLIVLIPTLLGIKRGTVKAGVKLAVAILAAIISFIVCKVSMPKMKTALLFIARFLFRSNDTMMNILETVEDGTILMSIVIGLAASLVIPFLFVFWYVVIKAILGLLASIVLAILRKSGVDFSKMINFGWALGLVQGVLSLVIIVMPVIGILNIVRPFEEISNAPNDEDFFTAMEDMDSQGVQIGIIKGEDGTFVGEVNGNQFQVIGPDGSQGSLVYTEVENSAPGVVGSICDSFPIRALGAIGAEPLFRALTTFKVDKQQISLLDESQSFAECLRYVDPLMEIEMKDYSSRQARAIRHLSRTIQNSDIVMLVFGEILPDMADNWSEGKTFMGMKSPSFGSELDPLKDQMLEIMSEINRETVKEDVEAIFEVAAIIFEHETLKYADDEDALFENITEEGYVSELMSVINSSERLKPLSKKVTDLGVRSVGTSLEIPDESDPLYTDMVNDVAGMICETAHIESNEERHEKLCVRIENVLEKAGVETTKDEREIIAHYLIDEYGNRSDVTSDEINDLFKEICNNSK